MNDDRLLQKLNDLIQDWKSESARALSKSKTDRDWFSGQYEAYENAWAELRKVLNDSTLK